METQNRWLTGILFAAMLVGALICLGRITKGNSTANEALLLSSMLTMFSILGSLIASRYYSEFSFNKNLRVFASKAAEKVTNLSNELDRLSVFLQQELKSDDHESLNESLLAKNLRIEAAIHIINTLKAANEKSLSDWRGVIGDEILTEQREAQEEREQTLHELVDRLDSLSAARFHPPSEEEGDEEAAKLRAEIDSMRKDVNLLAAQIVGAPVRQTGNPKIKQRVEKTCPQCEHSLSYRQRGKPAGIKAVQCANCGARLYSKELNGEFILHPRVPKSESFTCPACGVTSQVSLDPVPGSAEELECPHCRALLRITRSAKAVTARVKANITTTARDAALTENILARIKEAMGPQPWPPGRSRQVADELNLPRAAVTTLVRELVRRGVFKLQQDGTLYEPVKHVQGAGRTT